MDPDARRYILKLQNRADFLEQERARILEAIATITRLASDEMFSRPIDGGEQRGAAAKKSKKSGEVGKRGPVPPANTHVPGDSAGQGPTTHPPSVTKAVLEAIRAMGKEFTSVEIKAFLEVRYPALAAKLSGARISQELYMARKAKIITVVTKGVRGAPNVYRVL